MSGSSRHSGVPYSPSSPNFASGSKASPVNSPHTPGAITRALGDAHLQSPLPGARRPDWAYTDAEVRTSGAALPTSENMPNVISPRPELRVYNCDSCIKAWGTKNKKVENRLPPSTSCSMSAPTHDRCSNCKGSKAKDKCEISYGPEFYRAANIIEHLRRACRLGDDAAKARRLARFQDYCDRFIDRLSTFEKDVKKEYGSIEKYRHARRESFERNKKSYFKKTGVSGSLEPNNIVILKDLEEGLLVNMGNEEKRLIFFGKGAA